MNEVRVLTQTVRYNSVWMYRTRARGLRDETSNARQAEAQSIIELAKSWRGCRGWLLLLRCQRRVLQDYSAGEDASKGIASGAGSRVGVPGHGSQLSDCEDIGLSEGPLPQGLKWFFRMAPCSPCFKQRSTHVTGPYYY